MRKFTFLLILVVCIITGSVIAKEYSVKTGLKANVWSDIWGLIGQDMRLKYDTEDQSLLWYIDYTMSPIAIVLEDAVRITLLKYIQKYKEWNKKASQMRVKVNKKIGELPPTTVWFKYGGDWETDDFETIHVKFFSQSTQKHQLIIYFEGLRSSDNKYATDKPRQLYFWWNEVIALEKAISDKAVKSYIDKVNKKKSIEESFK